MTKNEKVFTAVAIGGAFALGWFLHRGKQGTGGNVTVHFNPNSVVYDVVDSAGNTWVPQTIWPQDVTLTPGDYTVDMTARGG